MHKIYEYSSLLCALCKKYFCITHAGILKDKSVTCFFNTSKKPLDVRAK